MGQIFRCRVLFTTRVLVRVRNYSISDLNYFLITFFCFSMHNTIMLRK